MTGLALLNDLAVMSEVKCRSSADHQYENCSKTWEWELQ